DLSRSALDVRRRRNGSLVRRRLVNETPYSMESLRTGHRRDCVPDGSRSRRAAQSFDGASLSGHPASYFRVPAAAATNRKRAALFHVVDNGVLMLALRLRGSEHLETPTAVRG